MSAFRRLDAIAAAALLCAAGTGAPHVTLAQEDGAARVVVVADVHGAHAELVELLQAAGVVDRDLAWAGGRTRLVSLGDLLDRGPDSRLVMDLLMRLETEAPSQGGRVHVVLGNHELMNLIGDLRYVSPAEYAAFAPEETAAMREAAFERFRSGPAAGDGGGSGDAGAERADGDSGTEAAARAQFDRRYPPGYFAHRAAFSLDGRYGAWLASKPAALVIGDTAFVHGGLPSLVAESSLDALNDAVRTSLHRYLELREHLAQDGVLPPADMQNDVEAATAALDGADGARRMQLEEFLALAQAPETGLDGPLWYRGTVYCKPLLEEPVLDDALARLGVERVVVGHTPTESRRVQALYGGKVVMLDTGMLAAYYRGRPAALVIDATGLAVQYAAPRERQPLEPVEAPAGGAYGLSDAALRAALERGEIVAIDEGAGDEPAQASLRHEGAEIAAWFYTSRRGADLELAAAALDDLLGTSLVAPTVPRRIDGTDGALQLRYPGAISEARRREQRLGLTGWCPIETQLDLMYAFDVLTFNRGRSAENVLYRNELSDLTLMGHGQAFGAERSLPAGFDAGGLDLPAALVETLRTLDEQTLEMALGTWLDARRLRALLARRDALLSGR